MPPAGPACFGEIPPELQRRRIRVPSSPPTSFKSATYIVQMESRPRPREAVGLFMRTPALPNCTKFRDPFSDVSRVGIPSAAQNSSDSCHQIATLLLWSKTAEPHCRRAPHHVAGRTTFERARASARRSLGAPRSRRFRHSDRASLATPDRYTRARDLPSRSDVATGDVIVRRKRYAVVLR
jgi:hypothetical protein